VPIASFTIFLAEFHRFGGSIFTVAGFVRRIVLGFHYAANADSVAHAGLFFNHSAEQRHADGGCRRAAGERDGDGCQELLGNGVGGDYRASSGGDEQPGYVVTDSWDRAECDADGGGYGGRYHPDLDLYRDFWPAVAHGDCGTDSYAAVDTASANSQRAGRDDLSL